MRNQTDVQHRGRLDRAAAAAWLCASERRTDRRSSIEGADDLADRLRRGRAGDDRVELRQVSGAAVCAREQIEIDQDAQCDRVKVGGFRVPLDGLSILVVADFFLMGWIAQLIDVVAVKRGAPQEEL
jgi:hypothetical protein